MKESYRLTYEMLKLRNRRDLEALIRRSQWQGTIYTLCGLAVALALGWAALKGWSR